MKVYVIHSGMVEPGNNHEDQLELSLMGVWRDEEKALENFREACESFGVDDNELEMLLSMSLHKPGRSIKAGDGASWAVTIECAELF